MNKNLNQLYKWMKVIDHSGPTGLAVELGLGSIPLNLESTLASIALGGSACVMLQTLLSNVTIGAELSDNFVFPLLFTSSVYFANHPFPISNSPFRPFILATTSIGQEGLDFHKYCRELMHWSLPDNAIDLEQREGRINRYKHFALRLNLFERYKGN
ncbi:MAG: hypothetical protein IPF81_18335 [Bacteroidetes bacterium]|nr:hypothetical protein [Bacteroidota bacterium]